MTHIYVANPSISLIGPGRDLQNSVRPRWVNTRLQMTGVGSARIIQKGRKCKGYTKYRSLHNLIKPENSRLLPTKVTNISQNMQACNRLTNIPVDVQNKNISHPWPVVLQNTTIVKDKNTTFHILSTFQVQRHQFEIISELTPMFSIFQII